MPSTSTSRKPSVLIVGGGLAGLVCAARMTEHGHAVTVLESRGRFGGRATSWRDPALGFLLDNGPHLVAGAYEELRRHARRVGLRDLTAGSAARPVVIPSGQTFVYGDSSYNPAAARFGVSVRPASTARLGE